ncbi:MAG: DUF3833 family protein [Pseudomonadota bacterium]
MDVLLPMIAGAAAVLALAWLRSRYAGFLAQGPNDYAAETGEEFDVREHLNGPVVCEGMIYGPTGRVSSRFHARFDCAWEGDTGQMIEKFWYDDGSVQDRAWHLHMRPDGRIGMQASDVVGEGLGVQSGPTVQMKYKLRLPEASGGHVLDVVDWMYLAPNGTILNRSQFRKYGVQVAELVATMRPAPEEQNDGLKDAA